jgi:hypothetical protein
VTERAEPGVILTVRREHMRTHAGQVAFPGGRIDPARAPLKRRCAKPGKSLGFNRRPPMWSGKSILSNRHGYVVTPVLAVVEPDQPLSPHEHEVADWFEAPSPSYSMLETST